MAWIDKLSNITYSDAQLEKRYDSLIQRDFPLRKERAMNRKAFGQVKGKYVPNAKEVAAEVLYEQVTKDVRVKFEQAKLDNTLLKKALKYEKAELRLQKYLLSEGVQAVAEVKEVKDKETLEVTQEAVPEVKEIKPLPATIEVKVYNGDGIESKTVTLKTVPNPLILKDIEERTEAQDIISSSEPITLSLVNSRKPKTLVKEIKIESKRD